MYLLWNRAPVEANAVIEAAKEHPHKKHLDEHPGMTNHQSWSRDEDAQTVPKYELPAVGIPSRSAYHLLHDELTCKSVSMHSSTGRCLMCPFAVDGNPTLNLASFVHTWMPEYATKLIMENINKFGRFSFQSWV